MSSNAPSRAAIPTRLLCDPNEATRHRYVSAVDTAADGVLARWRYERSEHNQANYPDDSSPGVDAAGTYQGRT